MRNKKLIIFGVVLAVVCLLGVPPLVRHFEWTCGSGIDRLSSSQLRSLTEFTAWDEYEAPLGLADKDTVQLPEVLGSPRAAAPIEVKASDNGVLVAPGLVLLRAWMENEYAFVAFDTETLKPLWGFTGGGLVWLKLAENELVLSTSVGPNVGTSQDADLIWLNPATGRQTDCRRLQTGGYENRGGVRWAHNATNSAAIVSMPDLAGDPKQNYESMPPRDQVGRIDLETGAITWTSALPFPSVRSLLATDQLSVAGYNSDSGSTAPRRIDEQVRGSQELIALDSQSGAKLWSIPAEDYVSEVPVSIDAEGQVITHRAFLTDDGEYADELIGYSPNGVELWRYGINRYDDNHEIIEADGLLVGCFENVQQAIDTTTGELVWEQKGCLDSERAGRRANSIIEPFNRELWTMDLSTGERAATEWPFLGGAIVAIPNGWLVITDDQVIVTEDQ